MRRLQLPIHDPCHEDWDAMTREDAARRFCDVCTKQVHDLSAMTQTQARSVLTTESRKGRVCVRYKADTTGNIRFLPERTTAATSFWRMSLAAASLGLMMLSGCVDTQPDPDDVKHDRCVYEVGPWSFTAERGQGSCPEPEEEEELLGKIAIDPEPEPVMGEQAPPPELGEVAIEPKIEPVHEYKGKIAAPAAEPEPLMELKGDVAFVPEDTEPCPPQKPPNSLI